MQGFSNFRRELRDLSPSVVAFMAITAAATAGTATALVYFGEGVGSPVAVAALAIIAAISEWRGRIALRGNLTVSISLFPSVFAAVLFGPLAGMIVFGASAACLNMPIVGRVAYVSNRALSGAAAGAAAAIVVALTAGTSGPGRDDRGLHGGSVDGRACDAALRVGDVCAEATRPVD